MMDEAIRTLTDGFAALQQACFEPLVPLLFAMGWGHVLEEIGRAHV